MSLQIALFSLFLGTLLLILLSLKWDFRFDVAARLIAAAATVSLLLVLAISRFLESSLLLVGLGVIFHIIVYVGIIAFLFYRDPRRIPPQQGRCIISPADGEVIYTKKLAPGALLESKKRDNTIVLEELHGYGLGAKELWQVGISMKFTDVHVNRAPVAGRVAMIFHRPGRFVSLRRENALNVNERQTILIEGQEIAVAIVQIASRLVRRIESYVQRLEQVDLGQRIGMIKFGSQVDIFFPTEKVPTLAVKKGQRLLAGESVIAQCESTRSEDGVRSCDGMIKYKDRYRHQFATETEWLERNAFERVNSIQSLLENRSITPHKIVELGCGPGALLRELKRRNIGQKYTGIDYSEEAIAYIKKNIPDVEAIRADITSQNFLPDDVFDLVILVHVLQHVENPEKCLESIAKNMRFSYLLVEVPLEDSLTKQLREKRSPSRYFHRSFSFKTFKQLLVSNGLSIIAEKRFAPVYGIETLRVQSVRQGWSKAQYFKKILTSHCVPKYLGLVTKHLHYSHYVALCKKV
jgi:phosphatidylserine decarboxylase